MTPNQYGPSFQRWLDRGATRSAEIVVPLVYELVRPDSVVDIGCGNGGWLGEFRRLGTTTVLGVDGDYVDRASLRIERDDFAAHDLSRPFECDRRFDLAISLEVAEHLPSTSADMFVGQLVRLAPVVLFSAAIPYQGGVGHVNEQWPDYWAAKFAAHGYAAADCLRPRIWTEPEVDFWYAQNLLLFADADRIAGVPALAAAAAATDPATLSRVHPAAYLAKARNPQISGKAVLRSASEGLKRLACGAIHRVRQR